MTLGTALNLRHNSLNALRLVLAMLVVVSHAPLAGGFGPPPMIGDLELGGWAVAGFFTISGWLITASRLNLDLRAFVWRRALRIYPAFWGSLVIVAFGLAPVAAAVGHGEYRFPEAVGFVTNNFSLMISQPTIDGTLVGSPYQSHWNLSLWTLRWEFLSYLGVAALLTLAWVRRNRWVLIVTWVLVSIPYAVTFTLDGSPSTAIAQGSRLGGYFLAGAVAYVFRDKIPSKVWLAAVAAVTLAALAASGWVGCSVLRHWHTYAYGSVLSFPLQRIGRTNDVSYGVYVYAFPIELLLGMLCLNKAGIFVYTGASIIAVLPIAWASWRFVERPCLRLKKLVRPRGQVRIPANV